MTVEKIKAEHNHFWYLETLIDNRIFDGRDAELINNRLSLEELKRELHNAKVQKAVSRAFCEDVGEEYWHQYAGLIEYLYYGRKYLIQLDHQKERLGQGKSSRQSARDVKESSDIVEVIGRYISLKRIGQRYEGLCPFHDDQHPSLSITPETQRWKCFGCGRGGDVIDFIKLIENLDTGKAIEFLGCKPKALGGVPL